jgi:thiamine kinase-like enzyme
MIEGLNCILEDSGQPGLTELRSMLRELLGGPDATGRVVHQQTMIEGVYRLRVEVDGRVHGLVVKRSSPSRAKLNQLVAQRWLPAVGLGECCPRVLGATGERTGRAVWQVYEDLGDAMPLDSKDPAPQRVRVVVELIAQLHTGFADHPLLAECRRRGHDRGIHFYTSNVRDAIRALEALRPPVIELSPEQRALRDRLLERMYTLLDEQPRRAQALAELGGPETLLHGDLWTTNTLVVPGPHGLRARLIDWDHASVGPASYDLSTFLLRFAPQHRLWIVDLYREAVGPGGWRVPSARHLNLLFDTAERARRANHVIWPAIAFLQDRADWALDRLKEVDRWFEVLQPVLLA